MQAIQSTQLLLQLAASAYKIADLMEAVHCRKHAFAT